MTYFTMHILQIHPCFWKWQDMTFYCWIISQILLVISGNIYQIFFFLPFVYQWVVRLLPYLIYCNRAIINIGVHIFVQTSVPRSMPRKGTAGSCESSIFLKGFYTCRRLWFNPWVGKIPWRREWQPSPVSLPGKSHGQRSLIGYSRWGRKESGLAERLALTYCFGWWLHLFTLSPIMY